jgi:hypothetical protein
MEGSTQNEGSETSEALRTDVLANAVAAGSPIVFMSLYVRAPAPTAQTVALCRQERVLGWLVPQCRRLVAL